jgi:hypothetical protein
MLAGCARVKGLAVVGVHPNGKGAEPRFQQGNIILDAGSSAVSKPEDLAASLFLQSRACTASWTQRRSDNAKTARGRA